MEHFSLVNMLINTNMIHLGYYISIAHSRLYRSITFKNLSWNPRYKVTEIFAHLRSETPSCKHHTKHTWIWFWESCLLLLVDIDRKIFSCKKKRVGGEGHVEHKRADKEHLFQTLEFVSISLPTVHAMPLLSLSSSSFLLLSLSGFGIVSDIFASSCYFTHSNA